MIPPAPDAPRMINFLAPGKIIVSPGMSLNAALVAAYRSLDRAASSAYKVAYPYSTTGHRPSPRFVAYQLEAAQALIDASINTLTRLKTSANDASIADAPD